eukprot:763778-Hanusia_phi.AAC.17
MEHETRQWSTLRAMQTPSMTTIAPLRIAILLVCCWFHAVDYVNALEISETLRHACSGVENIIDTRQKKRAYMMCLRLNPFDIETRMSLGIFAQSKGWFDEARLLFESTLKLPVNSAAQHDAHNFLGVIHETNLLDPGRARHHFEAALAVNPHSAEAHHNLANLLWRTFRRKEAIAHYLEAHDLDPRNSVFVYSLASAILQSDDSRGSLKRAKSLFLTAIKLSPQFADAYRGLGHALRDLGLHAEASRAYEQIHQILGRQGEKQLMHLLQEVEAKLLQFSALLAVCNMRGIDYILVDVRESIHRYLASPEQVSSYQDAISYYLDAQPLSINLYDISHIVDPSVLLQLARRRGNTLRKLVHQTLLYQQFDISFNFRSNLVPTEFRIAILSSQFDGDHYISHAIITLLRACKKLATGFTLQFHLISSAKEPTMKERKVVLENLENLSNSFISAKSMSWHEIALHINSLNCQMFLDLDG